MENKAERGVTYCTQCAVRSGFPSRRSGLALRSGLGAASRLPCFFPRFLRFGFHEHDRAMRETAGRLVILPPLAAVVPARQPRHRDTELAAEEHDLILQRVAYDTEGMLLPSTARAYSDRRQDDYLRTGHAREGACRGDNAHDGRREMALCARRAADYCC